MQKESASFPDTTLQGKGELHFKFFPILTQEELGMKGSNEGKLKPTSILASNILKQRKTLFGVWLPEGTNPA